MQRTARTEQSKPVARAVRKPLATVYYHGRTRTEDGQHAITLSIRGQRYEYFLRPTDCDTTEFLCRKGLARQALNFAKLRAYSVLKIKATCTS